MSNLMTSYPGAPGSANWWHVLDRDELARREALGLGMPERTMGVLEWDAPPVDMNQVTELRVIARSAELTALPEWVAALPRLVYLDLPIRFMKSLSASAIPDSLEVLSVDGSNTVTVPKTLRLPSLNYLLSNTGTLKFSHDTFPALQRLSLGLDRPQKMLDVVASYPGLSGLHLSSVHAPDLFERLGGLSLEYLGLVSGRLESLRGIDAFARLTALQLKTLPNLTDLSGLESLDSLEELAIGYCNGLRDVGAIARLPNLRKLSFFGVRDVGVSKILPELEAMGLDSLSLAGAT